MSKSLHHDRLFAGIFLVLLGIVIGALITAQFDWTPAGNADRKAEAVPDGEKYFQDPETNSSHSAGRMDSVLLNSAFAINKIFTNAAGSVIPAVVSIRNDIAVTLSKKDGKWYHFWEEGEDDGGSEGIDQKKVYPKGLGSGVVISSDGYILTNHHVVEQEGRITVIFKDRTEYPADIVGSDLDTDIALLKIDTTDLYYAEIGNSNQSEVGEWVLAIGTPFRQNLNSTVTSGIISAMGRDIEILRQRSRSSVEYFIQTDAVINPGNSGGPLINLKGEVIGINTAILSYTGKYQGYGFSVPINLAMHVAEDLKKYGKVLRGFLGVHITDVSFEKLQELNYSAKGGVEIVDFMEGGPAHEAGLQDGDIIISIDNIEVTRPNELQNVIMARRPGDQIKIDVLRDGEKRIYWVTLREMELNRDR